MKRQDTDVVVFRNLAPVGDPSTLTPESRRALAEFRAALNVGADVDFSGEWWGVIVLAQRRFHRCSSRQEAETLGTDWAREARVAAWIEEQGHVSAKVLADFR